MQLNILEHLHTMGNHPTTKKKMNGYRVISRLYC